MILCQTVLSSFTGLMIKLMIFWEAREPETYVYSDRENQLEVADPFEKSN